MQRPVLVAHSSFIEGLHTTKNMASVYSNFKPEFWHKATLCKCQRHCYFKCIFRGFDYQFSPLFWRFQMLCNCVYSCYTQILKIWDFDKLQSSTVFCEMCNMAFKSHLHCRELRWNCSQFWLHQQSDTTCLGHLGYCDTNKTAQGDIGRRW
jgi:hypothetical protein